MFVSSDDYPSFRDLGPKRHKKADRFKTLTMNSTCSLSDSRGNSLILQENSEKHRKKYDSQFTNNLSKINETFLLEDVSQDNISSFLKYKKLDIDKKKLNIFHLPPILKTNINAELNFMTFNQIEENNEKIMKVLPSKMLNLPLHTDIKEIALIQEKTNKNAKKLYSQLIYNKTQFEKLTNHYKKEEIKQYKNLFQEMKTKKQKERNLPTITSYPSLALLSNGKNQTNYFTDLNNNIVPEIKIEDRRNAKSGSKIIGNPIALKQISNQPEINIQTYDSSVYFYDNEIMGWRPEIRELCTMIIYEKKAYIYSGIGRNVMEDLIVGDLTTGKVTWSKFETTGDAPNYGRYGHSSILYNKKMYVFGGEKKYNSHLKQHECLSDIKFLNLENLQWKYIRTIGDPVDARRNHVATMVGRYMIVYGGISPKDQYLNDFWSFDTMINKWTIINVKSANKLGVAFHSGCSIFLQERSKIVLNKPLEVVDENSKKLIQYEGVYYFGGKNTNFFSNELSILLIDRNPMQLIKPEIAGKPPAPRYSHTFSYNEFQNIAIVYGGRNDYEDYFYSDIHILKLNILTWITVKCTGITKPPRASHCACSYNSKLIVFGGLNLNGLVGSELIMIELDQGVIRKLQGLEPTKFTQNQQNHLDEDYKKKINNDINVKQQRPSNEHKNSTINFFEESEQEKKRKRQLENMVENLKFQNFRSFLPVPTLKFGNKGFMRGIDDDYDNIMKKSSRNNSPKRNKSPDKRSNRRSPSPPKKNNKNTEILSLSNSKIHKYS